MTFEKENMASAPIYPIIEEENNYSDRVLNTETKAELLYRLNRTNDILNELKHEKKHYETVYRKYKTLHKTFYTTQLACNSSSVISATVSAGSLATGFGAVVAVPIGVVSVVSGCFGILTGIFDKKILIKMKKHSKLVQLAATMDSEIMQKYLNDQHITKEEFTKVLKILEKYYTQKEELRLKSQLVGNLEKLKDEFIEQGKKLAYLEAMNPRATQRVVKKAQS